MTKFNNTKLFIVYGAVIRTVKGFWDSLNLSGLNNCFHVTSGVAHRQTVTMWITLFPMVVKACNLSQVRLQSLDIDTSVFSNWYLTSNGQSPNTEFWGLLFLVFLTCCEMTHEIHEWEVHCRDTDIELVHSFLLYECITSNSDEKGPFYVIVILDWVLWNV